MKIFKIISIIITLIAIYLIFTIPCIFHPFDFTHDCYDCGFKEATGRYPTPLEKKQMIEAHKYK